MALPWTWAASLATGVERIPTSSRVRGDLYLSGNASMTLSLSICFLRLSKYWLVTAHYSIEPKRMLTNHAYVLCSLLEAYLDEYIQNPLVRWILDCGKMMGWPLYLKHLLTGGAHS